MNDTSPEIEQKVLDMMMKKTNEERFKMGCSMYDFSRKLVESSILNENPDISKIDLKLAVFERFYGNDFTSQEKEKIYVGIRAYY